MPEREVAFETDELANLDIVTVAAPGRRRQKKKKKPTVTPGSKPKPWPSNYD